MRISLEILSEKNKLRINIQTLISLNWKSTHCRCTYSSGSAVVTTWPWNCSNYTQWRYVPLVVHVPHRGRLITPSLRTEAAGLPASCACAVGTGSPQPLPQRKEALGDLLCRPCTSRARGSATQPPAHLSCKAGNGRRALASAGGKCLWPAKDGYGAQIKTSRRKSHS